MSPRFESNRPVQLALDRADAEPEGEFQWRYPLADGRDLVVSRDLAASINLLELQPGELFWICKRVKAGERLVWDCWLDPATEKARARAERPDMAELLRESIAVVVERK